MKHIFTRKIPQKYSIQDLQHHFETKYNLKLPEKYFEYNLTDEILVLDENYFKEIQAITKEVDAIFVQAYQFYIEEIEKNLAWENSLFIEYLKTKFFTKEYLIGRYDVLIEKETWNLKFLEFNANTPGLITDINDVSQLLKPKWFSNISWNFWKYITSKFKKYSWKKVGILLPYSYADEDFLVCQDYKSILTPLLWEENIIIWDIFESNIIKNNFLIKWEKIDVILNFFPLEFFLTDSEYAKDFFELVKNNHVEILNNMESIVLQDKLMFAVIWENIKKYSPGKQEIIKKHIPFTSRIFQEDESRFLAKTRFWRLSKWIFESNFYWNIEDKNDFIFQEKVYSDIIDENNNFLILWIFSNLKSIKALTSRKQNVFITNDDTVKVLTCYTKKLSKIT